MKYKLYYRFPLIALLIALLILGFAYIVKELWNALIPVLFNGTEITFWQATGIFNVAIITVHSLVYRKHAGDVKMAAASCKSK